MTVQKFGVQKAQVRRQGMTHEFTIIIERDPESDWLVGSGSGVAWML